MNSRAYISNIATKKSCMADRGQVTHERLGMTCENWDVFLNKRKTRLKVGKKQSRKERKFGNMAKTADLSITSPALA